MPLLSRPSSSNALNGEACGRETGSWAGITPRLPGGVEDASEEVSSVGNEGTRSSLITLASGEGEGGSAQGNKKGRKQAAKEGTRCSDMKVDLLLHLDAIETITQDFDGFKDGQYAAMLSKLPENALELWGFNSLDIDNVRLFNNSGAALIKSAIKSVNKKFEALSTSNPGKYEPWTYEAARSQITRLRAVFKTYLHSLHGEKPTGSAADLDKDKVTEATARQLAEVAIGGDVFAALQQYERKRTPAHGKNKAAEIGVSHHKFPSLPGRWTRDFRTLDDPGQAPEGAAAGVPVDLTADADADADADTDGMEPPDCDISTGNVAPPSAPEGFVSKRPRVARNERAKQVLHGYMSAFQQSAQERHEEAQKRQAELLAAIRDDRVKAADSFRQTLLDLAAQR
eukprot:jgi/Mesvir1/24437/Mv20001-RA.1